MKNIKQFNDFAGEDGYLIVDGLSNEVEGGRKKLSDVKNEIISEIPEPPEQVNTDWNAESGKAQILNVPDVLKEIPEPDYSSGGTVLSVKSGELRWDWPQIDIDDYVDGVTIDADANNSLYVLNPLPEDVGEEGDVLTVENGEPTWKELEIPKVTIESISIDNTELVPDENKNVNIAIESDCGLYVNNNNELSFGVDSSDTSPLYIGSSNVLSLHYDGTLTMVHSGSDENYLSVAEPLPSKSKENYRKILVLNDNKDTVWSDNISFGSGSEEGGNDYITPKIPVAVPKDFSYSEDDHHGFPSNYEIEWRDATPPAPNPGFAYSDSPIGTKKSFNLISTVQNINEGFYNTREYDYDWEETQTIPDPKKGSHNGHILTYDSSEGIVWTAPTSLTKAEADTYYAPKSEFDDLVAWLAPISANLVIAASNN